MDREGILQQLKAERERLNGAIDALEGSAISVRTSVAKKKAGGITAAGRRRLSQLMRKRWAARRKAAAGKATVPRSVAKKK